MQDNDLQPSQSDELEPEIATEPTSDPKEMSFVEHLGELRKALIVSVISVFLAACLGFYFHDVILNSLMSQIPIKDVQFIFVSPAEAFTATLKLSVFVGLFIALPIVLREIFWFIGPALSARQKFYTMPVILGSYVLFLLGVAFAYFILLPVGSRFLIGFAPSTIKPMLSIGRYIGFAGILLLGTGLIFQLPLLLFFLNLIGIVSHEKLKQQRRYAVLASFIVAAILTPSVDIFTQSLLAGALIVLYEFSLILIGFAEKRRKKREQKRLEWLDS